MNINTELIKSTIRQKGLLMKEVASKVDVNVYNFSRIINGKMDMSPSFLQRLSSVLGLSPEEIIDKPLTSSKGINPTMIQWNHQQFAFSKIENLMTELGIDITYKLKGRDIQLYSKKEDWTDGVKELEQDQVLSMIKGKSEIKYDVELEYDGSVLTIEHHEYQELQKALINAICHTIHKKVDSFPNVYLTEVVDDDIQRSIDGKDEIKWFE